MSSAVWLLSWQGWRQRALLPTGRGGRSRRSRRSGGSRASLAECPWCKVCRAAPEASAAPVLAREVEEKRPRRPQKTAPQQAATPTRVPAGMHTPTRTASKATNRSQNNATHGDTLQKQRTAQQHTGTSTPAGTTLPAFIATLLQSAAVEEQMIDELIDAVLRDDAGAAKKTATALTGRRGQPIGATPLSAAHCSE